MPPKAKSETTKKPPPPVIRPPISDSSLVYVPEDAIEGFQKRIEADIDWTLLEDGARHHKELCKRDEIPTVTFSRAIENKINKSIINGFINEDSGLTLEQNWDFSLRATLWDNEKFATDDGKICFHNANCITDGLVNLIHKTVKQGDRNILKQDIKIVNVLRVNDCQMTDLDASLLQYKRLVTLNLCGNFIADLNTKCIPPSVRSIELQANRIADVASFAESLPYDLLYLGLARNLLTSDNIDGLRQLPYNLTVLDLSDNDIYHLEPVLKATEMLPNLIALELSGNPCSVCAGYARMTLMKLPRLRWLDCREILPTDRSVELTDIHPDDLRAAYFHFTIFRIMGAPQPPKPEKGANTSFHIELEIPLLDEVRRTFLMFRKNESLIDMLPPPEDDDWTHMPSVPQISRITPTPVDEASLVSSDIYSNMIPKNAREIHNFTTFESNRVQWNKVMNFQEPAVKIFCPDLIALRDTFRSAITVRLVYSVSYVHSKAAKNDKKSGHILKMPTDMRVTLATIRCCLKMPDWSQPSQHFHWDDTLGNTDAIHWGDGDLAVIQYSQVPLKTPKGKPDGSDIGSRQVSPENLTCHFGFGIDTLRSS